MDLAPGQYVLVVADVNAFESAYGQGLPVAGRYSGSLSNGGERIQLCDAIGRIIEDFTYADNWYKITDGGGYSLTVVDVKADPNGLSSADRWRPSAHPGGSPGRRRLLRDSAALWQRRSRAWRGPPLSGWIARATPQNLAAGRLTPARRLTILTMLGSTGP